VRRFLRAEAEFAELVPEDFRGGRPELVILIPPTQERSIAKEMNRLMREVSSSSRAILHLRMTEEDQTAMYFVVDPDFESDAPAAHQEGAVSRLLGKLTDDHQPDYLKFTLSAEYIADRLNSHRPAMLPCLVSGLTDTFEAVAETERGLYSQPDTLLTMDDWRAVRFDAEAPRPLLPIDELLGGPPSSEKDLRYRTLWRAEAELFVRWALFGRSGNGTENFWRFARESARHGVNEQIFQSCFGLDYSDCRDALSDYLQVAARKPANWSVPVPTVSKLWFRPAKLDEVDWFKGEWNRLILTAVEHDFPTLLPIYRQQALNTLNRALEHGLHNARVLSSLGLLRIEMGDDNAAMSALEEAVAAGAERPMVFTELARLRLAHYLSAKREPHLNLTESEATQVLDLVYRALKSSQRVHGAYPVARAVFQHLDRPPTPEENRLIEEAN
jgi:hypothetical protein